MPYNRPRHLSGRQFLGPAGNSRSGRQYIVDRQGWSRPQANRRGIAGISAVLARVEGLQTLQEIIVHADDMSTAFDDYQPEASTLRDPAPLLRARAAVHARAWAEAEVAAAVAEMRDTGYSWSAIGMVLGTTGEAARQRYGGAATESVPALRAAEPGPMAAKSAKAPRRTAETTTRRGAAEKSVPAAGVEGPRGARGRAVATGGRAQATKTAATGRQQSIDP